MRAKLAAWQWLLPILGTAALAAASHAQPANSTAPKKIVLNYSGAPWEQVLGNLAEQSNLPLLMDVKPPGTFSYVDSTPRTVDEAMDLVNGALLSKDFTLLHGRQFLALAPLDKPLPPELLPTVTAVELAKRGANEFVALTIQLKYVDPASISDEIKKFLSKHGTVAALSRLHLVTITDVAGNLRKVLPLVTKLDDASRPSPAGPPAAGKLERFYPLRFIDADKTLQVLQTILEKAGTVVAGPQNRSLIVMAVEADHTRIEKLLNKLDVEPMQPAQAAGTQRAYSAKTSDAGSLASSFQGIWSRKRTQASFSADKASNLLLVDAPEAIHKQVQSVLAELESAATAKQPTERVIRPKNSDPTALLTSLQALFTGSDIKLSLDPKGESLIVRAGPADMERVAKLLEQLDAAGNGAGQPIEVAIRLKHATASTLSTTLTTLFPKPTAVTYDAANNLLLIRAAADLVPKIQRLIERIDVPAGVGDRIEYVYKPKHATSTDLTALLTKLFPPTANITTVTTPGDQALILSVPKDSLDRVKSTIEMLDVVDLSGPSVKVEIYTPKHLTPTVFRDTIAKLYAARSDVTVTLDPRNQTVLVSAPEAVHRVLVATIAKIDVAPPTDVKAVTQQVYKLRHASAAELAVTLQKLYPVDRTQTEISADAANSLLLINATPDMHKKIADLLQKIDIPPEAKLNERIYRIDRLEPNGLLAMLRAVFGADGKTTASLSGDGHTIVVSASNAVHTKIDALLTKLRKEAESSGQNAAAAFRLQFGTASQVSAALQAAMPDAQTLGRITYEPTTNAILVVGPLDLQTRVKDMIATLDIDPTGDLVQKEYPAKHIPVAELTRKLRYLLPASTRTTVSHEVNREVLVVLGPPSGHERVVKILETIDKPGDPTKQPKREVVRIKNATAATLATTLQTAYPPGRYSVTITADAANNLLVLDAPPDLLAQVKELALKLDVPATGEKIERTYALRNGKADKLQPQLTILFPAATNVIVAAGSEGHSLVVSATAEMHERVQKIIAELDRAPITASRVEKVFRLEYATASSIARSLQLALADSDAQFVPDDSNRTIIASYDPRHEQRVGDLIKQADRPKANTERKIAVLPLATLEPLRVEGIVRRIFEADPADVRPSIETTDVPPQLIVRGSDEQIKQVKSTLVQLGEQPSDGVASGRNPDETKRIEPMLRAIRIDRGSPRSAALAVKKLWPRLRRNPLIVTAGEEALMSADSTKPDEPEKSPQQNPTARPLAGDPNMPVTLTYGNKRLLVSSLDPAAIRLVEQLVETLTEEPNPERGEFHVFALEAADSTEVAKAVDEAFNGRQQGGQNSRRRAGGERVRAVPDPAGNAVIVRASLVDLVSVENLIRSLDQKPSSKVVRSPRILPLKRAKADEIVAVLKEVYADYLQPGSGGPMALPGFSARAGGKAAALAVGVDASSNSLVVAASDEVFEQIKTLVGDLDRNLGEAGRSYRLLPLKNASPLDVEEALDILFDRPSDPKRKGSSTTPRRPASTRTQKSAKPRSATQKKASKASIPEQKTTRPMALGMPRPLEKTEVATIRSSETGLEISDTREAGVKGGANERVDPAVIPAGFAEAVAVASALQTKTPEIGAMGSRVEIRALPEIGVLLLLGDENELKQLTEIVARIEKLAADRRLTFRILPLAHAKSAAMADLLRDLYRRVLDSRNAQSRTEAQAEVIPLAKPNALLFAASKDDVDLLVELANQFDTPAAADGQFTVVKLEHARATDLVRTIQSFYANRNAEGDLAPEVVVEADPRSNAVVVHAAPRDLDEVKLLIKQLDTTETGLVNSLRVFPLRFGTADEISRVLQGAIQGTANAAPDGGQTATTRPRPSLQLILADGKNRRTVESSILDNVRITPNPRANTLIVSAPAQTMNLIEALIKQLDARPEAQAEIKVFTLANSDAAAMVLTLRTLFLQAQGPTRNTTIAPTAAGTGDSGSPLIELSFSVDPRTNSILAAGTQDQLEVVEAIILRLDGSNIEERKTEVHKLRNAIAGDVATAITDLLQRQTDVNRLQEGVSLRQQIESEVVVVPEVTTNSLLISSTPRFYAKLLAIIEKLDEAPPQVVIQVLIVQVDLDKSNEFGIEVGLQDSVLFRRGIFPGVATLAPTFTPQGVSITTNSPVTPGVPGFNFNNGNPLGNNPFTNGQNQVGGQGLSNFGVGRSSSAGYGGLVLSASSESVNMLLRALARDQRIEVLSRPQIMALDNQTAFIQVGQQVPLIQNSVIQANVGVVNTVTYQDVGIILVVTPKISPDGSVVLRVDPEISALAPVTDVDSRVEISTGVFARAINTTRAQTTVSARDGQTAVIGGLIRRESDKETRKVPILGDIPVVGWAFKYEQKRCIKRELLFFLTPHIVRNTDDAERIKQVESARMNWCLSNSELAELGLPGKEAPPPEPEKKSHFWHRKKAKPATPPGATEGLLPTTVTHEPPPLSVTTPKLDPSMWPASKPRSAMPENPSTLLPAKSEEFEKARVPKSSTGNATSVESTGESPLKIPVRWNSGKLPPPAPLPSNGPSSAAGTSTTEKLALPKTEPTPDTDLQKPAASSKLWKNSLPPRTIPPRLSLPETKSPPGDRQ